MAGGLTPLIAMVAAYAPGRNIQKNNMCVYIYICKPPAMDPGFTAFGHDKSRISRLKSSKCPIVGPQSLII